MSWKTVQLKDVATVSAGNSAPQAHELFEFGTFNFYRTSDVGRIRRGMISDSLDKLNNKGIRGLKKFEEGTILFPKSGASTFLNHRVMLEKEGYVSSHLAGIKANKEVLNDKYLFYLLTTIDAKNLVQDSNYPSLKTTSIEKIEFQLPPLKIQEKLVIKLDAVLNEIDKATIAVKANLKNAEALFQSYLKGIFEADSYSQKKLKDCCQIKPSKSETKHLDKKLIVSFLPMEALGINEMKAIPNQTRTLEEVSGSYTYFSEGDVLLAKITPCFENGKLGIATNLTNKVGFGSSEYIVFRPYDDVDKEWIYYYLNRQNFRLDGARHMSGAVGHKRVTREFIENSQVPIPSIETQKKLTSNIKNIFLTSQNLRLSSEKKLNELNLLRASVLNQAFKGELVRE